MARNKSQHNGAMVMGALLGGAVGGAIALWKTPYSGAELRHRIGLAPDMEGQVAPSRTRRPSKPLPTKALGLLEQAAAPLVGVKLGHTANNSQPGAAPGNEPRPATTSSDRISDHEFTDFPAQQPAGAPQG